MTDETTSGKAAAGSEKKPNEFANFMRDTFVRALDHYALRISQKDERVEGKQPKPVRKIADHWLSLEEEEKIRFFDKVIGAAELAIAAAPVAIASLRGRKKAKAEREEKPRRKKAGASKDDSPGGGTKGKKKSTAKKSQKKK